MLRETAYAKINLALHVRRRRTDGYHDLETLFAFCEAGDVVSVAPSDTLSLTIDGAFAEGLSCTKNLVVDAANLLGAGRGAALHLTKSLPVAAGIGGGSADAAATLRLLSRYWQIDANLQAIARSLGADVAACLSSTTARGEGRGDDLTPSEASVSDVPVLLVNPRIALSTAAVFRGWDGEDGGDLTGWRTGRNDLERSARQLVPEIGSLLDWLNRLDSVMVARMSGSGATCFALFGQESDRAAAASVTRTQFPDYWILESKLR